MKTTTPHVAVSLYVSTHVLMSSKPVIQSRFPVSDSSTAIGGIETGCLCASVATAPSIRDPPRKQTRWSCFGDTPHLLSGTIISYRCCSEKNDVHLSIGLTLWDELGGVGQLFPQTFPDEGVVYRAHCIFIHLTNVK
jgi:hypothetical protein